MASNRVPRTMTVLLVVEQLLMEPVLPALVQLSAAGRAVPDACDRRKSLWRQGKALDCYQGVHACCLQPPIRTSGDRHAIEEASVVSTLS